MPPLPDRPPFSISLSAQPLIAKLHRHNEDKSHEVLDSPTRKLGPGILNKRFLEVVEWPGTIPAPLPCKNVTRI